MGEIDNHSLTLKEFIDSYLAMSAGIRILTGCVSTGPLEWLLAGLPPAAPLSVIARSIPPDLQTELDFVFDTAASERGVIGHAFQSGRLRLGFNPEIPARLWLFKLSKRSGPGYLTVRGSSDLTWRGLKWGKEEQNEGSTGYGRFVLEESRWKRLVLQTNWLTRRSWLDVRHRCSEGDQTLAQISPVFKTQRPLTIDQIQHVVAEFFEMNTAELKEFSKRHPSTVIYAYEKIENYLRTEGRLQETTNETDTIQ